MMRGKETMRDRGGGKEKEGREEFWEDEGEKEKGDKVSREKSGNVVKIKRKKNNSAR